jgi:hypothetical protein
MERTMKQQMLEAKLDRVEAIARDALAKPDAERLKALLTIIQVSQKEKSLV